jgi:hypothetical protein
MKQNKLYVAPKVDVIMIEPQGILCASAVTEPMDFMGTGMEFGTKSGSWN